MTRYARGYDWEDDCGAIDLPAAPFDPSALFDNWWHAASGVTGSPVSQWDDVIAAKALTQGTLANRPSIANQAAYNNKPAITWDGSNDVLVGAAADAILGYRPYSVWWIGNRVAGANNYIWGNYYGGGASYMFMRCSGLAMQIESLPAGIATSGNTTPATPHSYVLTIDAGNNYTLYIDGVSFWTGNKVTPSAGATDQFRLGMPAGGANYRMTDWAVKRGAVLTAGDAADLHSYAQTEYGLP